MAEGLYVASIDQPITLTVFRFERRLCRRNRFLGGGSAGEFEGA